MVYKIHNFLYSIHHTENCLKTQILRSTTFPTPILCMKTFSKKIYVTFYLNEKLELCWIN